MKKIIAELMSRGYQAEEHEVFKNGVTRKGILIKNDTNVSPVIYLDGLSGTPEEIADKVISIYEEHKHPQIDIDKITDTDFILKNIYVGIQRRNANAPYIHRATKYQDIDEYLYVRINSEMTFKITEQIMSSIRKDTDNLVWEDELFEVAYTNTFNDSKLINLEEMLGLPPVGMLPLYVVTNTSSILGASQILNDDLLRQFASEQNVDTLYIIPSSIHECILIPYTDGTDIEMLSDMVKAVNADEVRPEEQLADNALVWKL